MIKNFPSFFKVPTAEDEQAMKNSRLCIRECHPEQLLTESKFLRLEALHELVKVKLILSHVGAILGNN